MAKKMRPHIEVVECDLSKSTTAIEPTMEPTITWKTIEVRGRAVPMEPKNAMENSMDKQKESKISDIIEDADNDANADEEVFAKHVKWSAIAKNVYRATGTTRKTLPSGVYKIFTDNDGNPIFSLQKLDVDELIRFKGSLEDQIMDEIENFWEIGANFKKYGYMHRRGYLLYGPAGSGKTCLVQLIIQSLTRRGGMVFLNSPISSVTAAIQVLREIEPNRKIICIFEDVEAYIRSCGEDQLLAFLDGEIQLDNILSIATTNYPEKLDTRIVARPRRFDRCIKIDMPKAEVRREYFTKKLLIGDDKNEIKKWVADTEGFSFAAMAELVISVKCLGNDYEDSVKIMRKLLQGEASSLEYYEQKIRAPEQAIRFPMMPQMRPMPISVTAIEQKNHWIDENMKNV